MNHHFKAGAATVDITPPIGTIMNGDFIEHVAISVHDQLFARALVLQNDNTTIAVVVVDICALPKDYVDILKKDIFGATGIPAENILISATHSHFSGSVTEIFLSTVDVAYQQSLLKQITKSIVIAKQKLQPAKTAFGFTLVPEHVVCRRYLMKPGAELFNPVTGLADKVKTNPLGQAHLIQERLSPVDPEVVFLAVKTLDDNWIAVLANYSMHYVGDRQNGVVSADYFGEFSRYAAELTGKNIVAMMSNGTSGDANIWDFLDPHRYPDQSHEKSKLIGSAIAEKVFEASESLEWETNPSLHAVYKPVRLRVRKADHNELDAAREIFDRTDYNAVSVYEGTTVKADDIQKIYAREQVLLDRFPEVIPFPVQVLKIGSGVIGGLGGEFFSSTGLALKSTQPQGKYFTICLANGYVGYVPPLSDFALGGYETWRCRTSHLEYDAEEILTSELLNLIASVSPSTSHK